MAAALAGCMWPLALLVIFHRASTFYVPGVAPINFHQNDPVEIKAVKLTSSRTQLPYEYYSLPFCQPDKITYKAENLGEVLRGDRIVNTPFNVLMNHEKKCEVLCYTPSKTTTLTVAQSKLMAERIQEDYYIHLIADNLPVASRLELYLNSEDGEKKKEKEVQFEHGYRLGFRENEKVTKGKEKHATAEVDLSIVHIGNTVYMRNFVRKWKDPKFDCPFTVTMATPIALKVDGRKPWIHLSDVRINPASHQVPPAM